MLLEMRQAAEVIGIVPAHFDHAKPGPLPCQALVDVLSCGLYSVLNRGRREVLTRGEKVLDLIENPRISNAGPPDHDAVHTEFLAVG